MSSMEEKLVKLRILRWLEAVKCQRGDDVQCDVTVHIMHVHADSLHDMSPRRASAKQLLEMCRVFFPPGNTVLTQAAPNKP